MYAFRHRCAETAWMSGECHSSWLLRWIQALGVTLLSSEPAGCSECCSARSSGECGRCMRRRGNNEGDDLPAPGRRLVRPGDDPGQTQAIYAKSRALVQRKAHKVLADAERGIMPAPERLTVEAFLERWLADAGSRLDQYTVKSYTVCVRRHIIPELGRIKLAQLQAAQVQALYTALGKQALAPKTIRNAHGVLHAALEQAVRWDLVPRNVAALVSPPRAEPPEFRTLQRRGGPPPPPGRAGEPLGAAADARAHHRAAAGRAPGAQVGRHRRRGARPPGAPPVRARRQLLDAQGVEPALARPRPGRAPPPGAPA